MFWSHQDAIDSLWVDTHQLKMQWKALKREKEKEKKINDLHHPQILKAEGVESSKAPLER